jgi:S-formylglutathione hydrolase
VDCPWGQKAFNAYLGDDETAWQQYDAVELLKMIQSTVPIRIDQGEMDQFLEEQLKPWSFMEIAEEKQLPVTYQSHAGYDHSYFFIQSFINEHLEFHARHLAD